MIQAIVPADLSAPGARERVLSCVGALQRRVREYDEAVRVRNRVIERMTREAEAAQRQITQLTEDVQDLRGEVRAARRGVLPDEEEAAAAWQQERAALLGLLGEIGARIAETLAQYGGPAAVDLAAAPEAAPAAKRAYHRRGGCMVPWCNEKHYHHGYCMRHAARLRDYGDPLLGKVNPETMQPARGGGLTTRVMAREVGPGQYEVVVGG